jgi:hypothetical protein
MDEQLVKEIYEVYRKFYDMAATGNNAAATLTLVYFAEKSIQLDNGDES